MCLEFILIYSIDSNITKKSWRLMLALEVCQDKFHEIFHESVSWFVLFCSKKIVIYYSLFQKKKLMNDHDKIKEIDISR